MSRYTSINTDLWLDSAVRAASPEEKLFYLYLLTGPLSNQAGYYKLPEAYVEMAFGKEMVEILNKDSKLFKYDHQTSQVLIRNYLKYNTIASDKQVIGLLKAISSLEICPLHVDFAVELYKYCDKAFPMLDAKYKKYLINNIGYIEDQEIRFFIRGI